MCFALYEKCFEALIGIESVADSSPIQSEITSLFCFISLFPFDQLALEDGVVNLHRNSMMSMDMLRVSDLKQREEKRVSNKRFFCSIKKKFKSNHLRFCRS